MLLTAAAVPLMRAVIPLRSRRLSAQVLRFAAMRRDFWSLGTRREIRVPLPAHCLHSNPSLLVNDDGATADHCGRTPIVSRTEHVIVDDCPPAIDVPYLDPELVTTTASREVPVDGGQQEPIVARTVDCPYLSFPKTRNQLPG